MTPFSISERVKKMINRQKGCHDIYGLEAKKWQYVMNLIDSVCQKYHYDYIRTPIFEASELYHRGIGEGTDIVTKEMYDFKDKGDRNITLRPEGTAGVVRAYLENKMYGEATQPTKLYYTGTMYRYERPQSGRDRELTQFGVEAIGSNDPMLDAEVISLAVNIYRLVGLKGIKVNLNTLGDKESRSAYRKALVDYLRPHIHEFCEDCQTRLEKNPLRILDCKIDHDNDVMKNVPKITDYLNEASKSHYQEVKKYLDLLDIEYVENPNIVRGLDYYDHTVFEIEADIEGFGSQNVLGGGGRYNGLVKELGGDEIPAVGFAMGLGRLMLAIEKENIVLPIEEGVDLFVMYVSETEKEYATTLVQELRMSGFSVETDYMNRSLKAQFKQADRLKSKFLIILNDEDLKENRIQIKNNKTKKEEKVELDYILYYLDEQLATFEEENNECDCDCDCDDCNHGHHHNER